ncbi:MAG: trypsin-like peptidase domain-containing protein [Spirochaetales bacterium]|nr:trypsin-like peptidase domain-containing protein [Spirochaetales bacterium]
MKTRGSAQLFWLGMAALLVILILLMGFGVIEIRFGGQTPVSMTEAEQGLSTSFDYQRGTLPVATEAPSLEEYSEDERQNIAVYETANGAVVNISTQIVGYNWFLEPVPQAGSSGSGSIIDARGYVLTNNHVVENAYKVNVTLADGETFEGEVIGSDGENDLAVVKFDPGSHPLTTIPFGDSSTLRVGQKVLAIGNPFAFERTLTTGIISGLGRPLRNDKGIVIRDLIQTDASINPGNSGGPLLNTRGQIIGVNTMIYTPSGGSVGIGFSVPVDTARRVVPDLIRYGFVQRGWIDIEPVQLFPSLVRYAKLPISKGILISQVKSGGNADEAGLRGGDRRQAVRNGNSVIYLGGDVITAIDGQAVTSLGDLYGALEKSRPGDTVSVTVLRGKRELNYDVVLTARDGSAL